MGKKSNITHQALKNLQSHTKYGESKHEAKEKARKEAKDKGEAFKEVRGIYSTTTYNSYVQVNKQFIAYVLSNHKEVKTFDDCKKYVAEFLQDKIDKNRSAWTIGLYASALACSYDCRKTDFGVELPMRCREDVKRCRGTNSMDYRYPEEKYDTARLFLNGCGTRRAEILRLRKEDFRERSDGHMEVFKRGKNNIERWCLVNPKYENEIRDYLRTAETHKVNGEDRLFLKAELPRGAVHDARATYAADLYRFFEEEGKSTGELYRCRKDLAGQTYDKGILAEVSYNLQHGRDNVVISYLWKM